MIDAKPTLVSIFLEFANEVDADHLDDASVEPFLIGAISAVDPEDYPERVTDSFGECYYEGGDDDNTVEAVSAVAFARGVDARILDRFNSARLGEQGGRLRTHPFCGDIAA